MTVQPSGKCPIERISGDNVGDLQKRISEMTRKSKKKKNKFPRSLVFNNHGEIRKGFIAFMTLLIINGTMLLVMNRVSFEFELILRRSLHLTLVSPLLWLWIFFSDRNHYEQLKKKSKYNPRSWKMLMREKIQLILSGLLSCLYLGFSIIVVSTVILDVSAKEHYLTATIVDIEYRYRSEDTVVLSNGEHYKLYPKGFEVNPGETYKFRIMEKSDLAVPWDKLSK